MPQPLTLPTPTSLATTCLLHELQPRGCPAGPPTGWPVPFRDWLVPMPRSFHGLLTSSFEVSDQVLPPLKAVLDNPT